MAKSSAASRVTSTAEAEGAQTALLTGPLSLAGAVLLPVASQIVGAASSAAEAPATGLGAAWLLEGVESASDEPLALESTA